MPFKGKSYAKRLLSEKSPDLYVSEVMGVLSAKDHHLLLLLMYSLLPGLITHGMRFSCPNDPLIDGCDFFAVNGTKSQKEG